MKGYGIQQRDSDGKVWRIQVYTGLDANGKRKRYTETFHGSSREANKRGRALADAQYNGQLDSTARLTVKDIFNHWLAGYVRPKLAILTVVDYESIVREHLLPSFGSLKPRDFTWTKIQKFYDDSTESGKWSSTTILKWHHALSKCFKWASRQGLVPFNPVPLCTPPRKRINEMQVWTPEELEKFLMANTADFYYPIVYTAVSCGLRQGELLALHWRDIDTVWSTISVSRSVVARQVRENGYKYKEPKTRKGRRLVAMSERLKDYFKEYRQSRADFYHAISQKLVPDDLVFTTIDFGPLHPSTLDHAFNRMVLKAGVKPIRFHDLRHTFATLALLQGTDAKIISEALGHSSVAFTLDTYSHIISGMQEDMARRINDVIPSGVAPDYLAGFNTKITPNEPLKTPATPDTLILPR